MSGRRKIGNDLGEAAAELCAVHLTPEHAKIDGGIQKPVGILMNEGVGEGRELAARGTVEEPDESEVMQADPSLGGNENVARVGIAVECAKDENLMQVSIDEVIGEARPVGFDRRIVDSPSAAPLLHNDSLADETFNDVRDVNRGRICKGGYETLDIAGFLTEIDLLAQVAPDLVDDPQGLIMTQARHDGNGEPRHRPKRPHVAIDLRLDAGTADLDNDVAPVMQFRSMDLRDRSRGKRLVVEMCKELLDRMPQPTLDLVNGIFCRKRSDVILERLQGGDVFIG